MTTRNDIDADGAALWRRARAAISETAPEDEAATAGLIAGYLDGRLDAADAARVEAWLASDDAALDLMLEVRAALAEAGNEPPAAVPQTLVDRAKGLVRARPTIELDRGSLFDRFFAAIWQPVGAAAAVAVLVASVAGFELGRTGYQNVAKVETLLAQQFSLGLGADELL